MVVMEWPELTKWSDYKSFEIKLENTLEILNDRVKCFKSSINKTKQMQQLKEQLKQSVEARRENIRRLEAKKPPIKQQIEKTQERISQISDEISKFITELERLKFKNMSLGKEVESCRKELRKVNEIHLKAMEHYKRKLQVRLEMDDNEKLTLYFTDFKGSVILSSKEHGIYKLIATEPELECLNKLAEMLESTRDVSGCIAHIRTLLQKKHNQHIREAN